MFKKVGFYYFVVFCLAVLLNKAHGDQSKAPEAKWNSLLRNALWTKSTDLIAKPEFREAKPLVLHLSLHVSERMAADIESVFTHVLTARQIFSICRILIDLNPTITTFASKNLNYDSSADQEAYWLRLLESTPSKRLPVLYLKASQRENRFGFAIVKESQYGGFRPTFTQNQNFVPQNAIVLMENGLASLATWQKSNLLLAHGLGHVLIDKIADYYHLPYNILSHAQSSDQGPLLGRNLNVEQCNLAREGVARLNSSL